MPTTKSDATVWASWILASCCCAPKSCSTKTRRCWPTTVPGSSTCWSMSSRTPTPFNTPGSKRWPAPKAPSWWSVTTPNPFTDGEGPRPTTCWPSWPTVRPRCSRSSRTTDPPPTSWRPRTRSSPKTLRARSLRKNCGPRPPPAPPWTSTRPVTTWTKPIMWCPKSPVASNPATPMPVAPCSTAPTPSLAPWKPAWFSRACPTASTAA